MTIVRTIPDIRSWDLGASRQFYEGMLGFRVAMDEAGMLIFASPTEPKQQIAAASEASGGGVLLPSGFSIDVGYPEEVTRLHQQATEIGSVILEPVIDKAIGIRHFSLLDPDGTRVTILAHLDPQHQPPR